jgi:hypothetical protein
MGYFEARHGTNNIFLPYSATKTSSRRQASGVMEVRWRYCTCGTCQYDDSVVRETLGGNTVLTPRARTSKGSASSEVLCAPAGQSKVRVTGHGTEAVGGVRIR